MALTLKLKGVNAISGGVLDLNGSNSGMASISLAQGWQPRVAKRRRGVLGGKIYEDVVEAIPLRIHGASQLECVTALETLAAAMDQAAEWRQAASVEAVTLAHAIDGTTLSNPLETAVLGTPDGAADILSLPITFNRDLGAWEVNPVTLPVLRRGAWYGDAETVSGTDTSTGNPDVVTRNFASSTQLPSPVDFSIEFTSSSLPTRPYDNLVVVVSNDADNIVYVEGETLTKRDASGGAVTNIADANASGGSVKRFNGGNGGYYNTSVNGARQIVAVISGRNNSTTTAAILKLQATTTSWGAYITGSPVVVDTTTTEPRIIILPLLSLPKTIARVSIDVSCASFDIDYVQFINMNSPGSTRVITSPAAATDENGSKTWFFNRVLTDLKPLIENTNSAGTEAADYPPWYGVRATYLPGDEISVSVAGVNTTKFFLADAGGVEANFRIGNVTRRPAYLVPR